MYRAQAFVSKISTSEKTNMFRYCIAMPFFSQVDNVDFREESDWEVWEGWPSSCCSVVWSMVMR